MRCIHNTFFRIRNYGKMNFGGFWAAMIDHINASAFTRDSLDTMDAWDSANSRDSLGLGGSAAIVVF